MNTFITISAALFFVSALMTPAGAQTELQPAPNASKLSVGVSGGHYRYDPGIAVEFTTRAIFQNHLSLRLRGGIQWLNAYQAAHHEWVSYRTYATGLIYNGKIFERTRFYAGIVPDTRFSDETFIDGFYEFNGLEITLLTRDDYTLCLYLGMGPAFVKAYAEKIEGRPRYGNGFYYVNGLRVYFGR